MNRRSNQARLASYTEKQVAVVPPALREKVLHREGDRYVFDKELRRSVIFGRHDLIHDAPISRVNLLLCRNTLMYFNTDAQSRILARFHFALADDGVLFLGKAEMLLTHPELFKPIDLRRRLFKKVVERATGASGSRSWGSPEATKKECRPVAQRSIVYGGVRREPARAAGRRTTYGLLALCNDRARVAV